MKQRLLPMLTVLWLLLLARSVLAAGDQASGSSLLANAESNTWIQLPGTKLKGVVGPESYREPIKGIIGPRGIVDAWNGAAWNEKEQWLDMIASGGHADYCGNGYYRFDLDDLAWTRVVPPSDMQGYNWKTGTTPDGRPTSRHTYQGLVYVPTTKKTYLFGGALCSGAGSADNKIWSFTENGDYEYLGKQKGYPSLGGHALYDPVSDYVYLAKRGHIYRFNIAKNKLRDLTPKEADRGWGTSAAIDVKRRKIFGFGHGFAWIFDIEKGTKKNIKLTGDFRLMKKKGVGLEYVERIDRYVVWGGGATLYFVDPETFDFTALKAPGKAPKGIGNGVYGRFRYSHKYDGFIVVSRYNRDVYFMKLGDIPKKNDSSISISMANPQRWINKAAPGDTVTIEPGIYLKGLKIDKPITLNLKGVQLWGVSEGKGILNISVSGGSVVINDFVGLGQLAGATWGNRAGIKIAGVGFDVTVNRADISGTVMGILTSNKGGVLRINDSYIHDTGSEKGKSNLSHIVYAGKIDELRVVNSRLERSNAQGHLFKSRAKKSFIINSKLLGDNSRHSRIIDLPCGGELTISKTRLVQSPRADNTDLMAFGVEACGKGKSVKVVITDSSIKATKPRSFLFSARKGSERNRQIIDGGGNTFEGVKSPW